MPHNAMMTTEYASSPGDKPIDGKAMAALLYSPRTITLGNQTESLLLGMTQADASTAMMLSAKKDEILRQKPFLPSTSALHMSPSRPIRIARRKPSYLQPRYANPNHEDGLSASPSELTLMYDEATWRMYHLIQTARLEKQAAKAAAGVPALITEETSYRPTKAYYQDEGFFLEPNTPPTSSLPVVEDDSHYAQDHEECLFELDDL